MNYEYNMRMYVNEKNTETIIAKQFDAQTRFLKIQLLQDNGMPYDLTNCRVQFNARKRSGKSIMNDAVILDYKNGLFSVELTDQALAEGDTVVLADITIFTNNSRLILTTRTFNIHVEKTIRDDEAVESSNEYNSVVILFRDVWDMRDTIKSIDERLGKPNDGIPVLGQQAGSSMFYVLNRIWNYMITQSTQAIVETVNKIKDLLLSLDDTLIFEWSDPGSYTWVVPKRVTGIYVTACGGGGGGAGGGNGIISNMPGGGRGGGGGGGAIAIVDKYFEVKAGDSLNIIVGLGGSGGSPTISATSGTSTVIESLITILGGVSGSNSVRNTINGIIGVSGSYSIVSNFDGMGGGGCLENGGFGGFSNNTSNGESGGGGGKGAGGGGGAGGINVSSGNVVRRGGNGGNGGHGYVKIKAVRG